MKAFMWPNIKGIGSGKTSPKAESAKFNSHQYHGSVSLVPLPAKREWPP